jgi:hypothetical protein
MTTFLKLFLLRPTLWLCDTLADAWAACWKIPTYR